MSNILGTYRREMEQELESILDYWMQYLPDHRHGGFYGKVDHDNRAYPDAPRGVVMYSRILWAFSAAWRKTGKEGYRSMATRAYDYLIAHFLDHGQGGVYWTVDAQGQPLDTKKQIYALAFAVYGISEYYHCAPSETVQQYALSLCADIVKHSHDPVHGGYIEALTRNWQPIADLRLSEKDMNERKSMNTHLHVLEAFANLYRIAPGAALRQQVADLLDIFLDHIIDRETGHLLLFFDDSWQAKRSLISYGHDIEAAWLLPEAAEIIQDEALVARLREASVRMAEAAVRGLDKDGGLWYEYDLTAQRLVKEKHWWPQSEAMVGFLNAWQVTGREQFLEYSWNCWQFVKARIRDRDGGEWYWGVHEDYTVMRSEDKAGLWKCPYHNSRACLEVINRLSVNY